jgi:hypothetical protein
VTGGQMLGEKGLRVLRTRAQLLDRPEPALSPDEIMRRVCDVQAQEISAAELVLRAGSGGLTAVDAREARVTGWSGRGKKWLKTMTSVPSLTTA